MGALGNPSDEHVHSPSPGGGSVCRLVTGVVTVEPLSGAMLPDTIRRLNFFMLQCTGSIPSMSRCTVRHCLLGPSPTTTSTVSVKLDLGCVSYSFMLLSASRLAVTYLGGFPELMAFDILPSMPARRDAADVC
jgi:hypothetical protein